MKRFAIRLAVFALLFLGYVVATHAWCWIQKMDDIEKGYALTPDQKFLFLGSSTLGCSIDESPMYSNKVLWVSASPLDATFMRLDELERRGQLNHVEVLALPFSVQMLTLFTDDDVKWSWYHELPVSWRHFGKVPFGRLALVKYILSNLRPKVPFQVRAIAGGEMDVPLDDARIDFLDVIKNEFCNFDLSKNYPGWEERFKKNIEMMLVICKRHNISPVVYRQPLLKFFKENLPKQAFVEEAKWISYFRSQGIPYMDIPEVYGRELFHDHMHLTTQGSHRFTHDWFSFFARFRGSLNADH